MRRELCGNPGYSANHAGKISASVPPFLTWSCCAKQQGAFKDEEWLLHLSREMGKWTSDVTYSFINSTHIRRPLFLCTLFEAFPECQVSIG